MNRQSSAKPWKQRPNKMNKTSNFMNMTMAQMVSNKEVDPLIPKKKVSKGFNLPSPDDQEMYKTPTKMANTEVQTSKISFLTPGIDVDVSNFDDIH